ncbi:MAG: MBL fold metallo-hydrolase [Thiohalomonadales bacterium]
MRTIYSCPRYFLSIVAILFLYALSSNAFAYRTDHGFLPPGANVCAAHVPVTLAIPPNALPVPDPSQGEFSHGFYHVEEIDDGLYYIADGVYFSMFLVSHDGIIVVDAPPSIGVNQLDPSKSINIVDVIYSIPATQGKPIKKLIYSHTHMDHIGAASIIQDAFPNVEIIAHQLTKAQLIQGDNDLEGLLPGAGSNPPPIPTKVFKKKMKVELGKQVLRLSYKGPAHEPGNIYIYAPKQSVLMLIDVIFPGWSPFNNLALAEEVPAYLDAYDEVLAYDFDIFIAGHINRLGTRADVEEAQQYMMDIKANALSALQNPALFQIFSILPHNALGAFSIYLDQMACDCANRTLDPAITPSGKDWRSRMGNADNGTLTHCWAMGEAMRIDPSF